MRRLLPSPTRVVEPYEAYRPADPAAPLLRLNMVASLDGAVTDARGVSGSLGGEGDHRVFVALRALADGILAGAGTVRAEGYGPHRLRPELVARREADGRTAPAPIVVVTRSVDLPLDGRLFTEAVTPTIVLTCAAADADRKAAVRAAGGVVVEAGGDAVDLAEGVALLRREHGLAHLLCEGGPTLNGQLLAAGLVDELCVTLAPTLVGGDRLRGLAAGLPERIDAELVHVLEHDGDLLLRYRVTGPGPAGR